MQVFVRIVESGSLTAAAEALGVSVPSVVRSLAALERAGLRFPTKGASTTNPAGVSCPRWRRQTRRFRRDGWNPRGACA
jgi:hypothetical protein